KGKTVRESPDQYETEEGAPIANDSERLDRGKVGRCQKRNTVRRRFVGGRGPSSLGAQSVLVIGCGRRLCDRLSRNARSRDSPDVWQLTPSAIRLHQKAEQLARRQTSIRRTVRNREQWLAPRHFGDGVEIDCLSRCRTRYIRGDAQ